MGHQNKYDVVHFHEFESPAYFCLLAKYTAQAFQHITFVMGKHSPTEFLSEGHQQFNWEHWKTVNTWLEKRAIELSDVVVSPSAFLLEWMRKKGWQLPNSSVVIQNLI